MLAQLAQSIVPANTEISIMGRRGKTKVKFWISNRYFKVYCPDCGEAIGEWSNQEARRNSWGVDKAIEDATTRHRKWCSGYDWDTVDRCPDCGEVMGRWDYEYITNWPNSSDMARAQAEEEHLQYCPGPPF